jgi:hypothetical protein
MTQSSTDSSLVERLSADRDEALRYATNLLTSYVNKYCDPVPEWAPLPDLIGVLTQIDNASTVTADILAQSQAAEARISTLERELEEARARFEKHSDYSIQLQRIIEAICHGRELRPDSAELHHHKMAQTYLTAAEAKAARTRQALKPFAEAADSYDPDEGDGRNAAWAHDFTIGSLRAALSALQSEEDREGGE